ncbi:MAG TPA: carboxypeptidase regulatory-like domain-containing protein [Bryobacteraceae bacterium]|nr:carboxypeptidase regulatory-like domain-containing protein [Bryobacteraceae bacterium]
MPKKLLLAVFGFAIGVFAQGERGTLNGTVIDPSGSVVVGATVKAVNIATGVEIDEITTDAGVYRLPYLQPGTYKLTVSAPGFKLAVRENIILAVAQTLTVDFKLEVGASTDQVTVSAEAPLLETGTAEIGSYVSKKEFDTWPITVGDGRRQIQQFIFTSLPGTVGDTFLGSINGGQGYSHEILIDGIALGRMDLQGGSNNEFSPSAEAISEFKLQTGMVGAQYGGGQTAVANFATKSGTNGLHGSGYWYVQNEAFRANGWSNNAAGIKRQPNKTNNFGYSVGGPVILPKVYNGKNKTFFFHNLERTRVRNFSSTSFGTLPIPAFKQGDFSRLFNPAFTGVAQSGTTIGTDAAGRPVVYGQLYDPSTARQVGNVWVRDPFPGNLVPKSKWDPVSTKILDLAPITDPLFDTLVNNIPTLGSSSPTFQETMLTLKADHNFTTRHRLSSTFNRNFRSRTNSPGGRWGLPPGTPTDVYQNQNTPGTLVRLAYDWTVTPTILNHAALGYNRFGNSNVSAYFMQDWPQKIGMQNVPGTHFPTLTFSGRPEQSGNIGAGGRLGSGNSNINYNGSTIGQDDLTIVHGAHNIKVGIEQRRYYYNNKSFSTSGTFAFSPNTTAQPGFTTQTGNAFASFLLGAASSTSRSVVLVTTGHRWRSTAMYLADDWKVNRRLTLNFGMRWEIIGGLFEVAGRMSGLDFGKPNPAAGGRLGALAFVDDLGRQGFMDSNYKQFSPKFGFAYQISNRLVMRGGYGINNTPPISNGFGFGGTTGFNGTISRNSGNTALRFAEEPVIYLHDRYPDLTLSLPNKDASQSNGQGISYTARNSSRLPYVQNWTFGFQYQLPARTVVEVNYIGNKGTRLEAYGFDSMNQVPLTELSRGNSLQDPWTPASGVPQPFPGFTGTVLQALRPYPQFTGISQTFPTLGTSLYNALQIQATRHLHKGLSILVAYAFSKAINMAGDNALDSESIADVYNRRIDRVISSFNYPQYLKVTWIYELPFGPNKALRIGGIGGKIVGGWSLTGNHFARSGNPIGIGVNAATNPITVARPDQILGVPVILNSDAQVAFRGFVGGDVYLNRAAFTDPPVSPGGRNVVTRLGTVGPLLPNVRGPMRHGHDLAVVKTHNFREKVNWEIRGVFTNFINHPLRNDPVTSLSSPFFGQITGKGGGRNVELSSRITF